MKRTHTNIFDWVSRDAKKESEMRTLKGNQYNFLYDKPVVSLGEGRQIECHNQNEIIYY